MGATAFGDPNAVSLYGMTPAQWHARGVRILARTALEAVRDPLGNRIGQDVARVAATAPPGSVFGVIDSFAGSCNALFSILREVSRVPKVYTAYEKLTSLGVRVLGAVVSGTPSEYHGYDYGYSYITKPKVTATAGTAGGDHAA